MNRDFVTASTPESRASRDLIERDQPTSCIDLHGYTSALQSSRTARPHGENYEYDLFLQNAYANALGIGGRRRREHPGNTTSPPTEARRREHRRSKIPFRDIRAGWDDWPPIFTAAVRRLPRRDHAHRGDPARSQRDYNQRHETAPPPKINIDGRGRRDRDRGRLRGRQRRHAVANQIEIFRRGAAGEPQVPVPAEIDPASVPEPTSGPRSGTRPTSTRPSSRVPT